MTTEVRSLREFRMPDVGEGLTEAEILTWYVKPGDPVTDGQIVCEVETAKAAVELPIPFTGTVEQLFFPAGATVDVGTAIITVAVAGGAPAPAAAAPASAPVVRSEPAEPAEPERREVLVGYGPRTGGAQRRARKTTVAVSNGTAAAPAAVAPAPVAPVALPEQAVGDRPLAKPPVRKLAKDLGVDLRTVVPTGPDGVITREDVHAALAPAPVVAPAPQAPVAAPVVEVVQDDRAAAVTGGDVRIPVKGVRKATAQAMVASAFTAPHVTEFVQVDVTRTMKFVRRLKETGELGRDVRVSPLLLVAKALLTAIKRHPEINAQWDEAAQEIVIKGQVNLGIAAATPRGLIVPNIKDAGARTLSGLATALGELVDTARQGRTSPADMQGGTVTITNVGVFGVDTGTPILNPGEAAILAFGAVRDMPWVHKGKVVPRQVTTLALSFDHRLVDGELGSKVLADVAALLERPKRLITWG
ncbi:dihydrolipoamide acetyltransferase component of pyruvate dehydrogenase complex [Kitasatospora herbaricolor]|uniref:dihydrolipoamide acetyltransferase family protein n=1 Tax=Kitasatospora herbaricolor TaxID=68217 RepID=UPI00174D0DB3|nr:dihydrolipoamide acetyltransferase family protein [Kitasatospora herbaricolor]MDQ0309589.1 pyruvate dehydrogenase E2 component (dihydrolipoamide acetyltransferase) [Kitasatospora herbaricolor]GGV00850.1 dihydrolipoamide acetyltransferase component of pyruvate dehydrogenase complex [Kitasatospora herbaricolor]